MTGMRCGSAGVSGEAIRRPLQRAESAGLQGSPRKPRQRIPVRFAGPHTRRDSVSGITVRDNFTVQ